LAGQRAAAVSRTVRFFSAALPPALHRFVVGDNKIVGCAAMRAGVGAAAGGREGAGDRRARVAPPRWLRLVRAGNTLTGCESADGVTWRQVGTIAIAMNATVHIGLAVTAANDGALCTATFDQVRAP
jgi:hypothetical protein